MSTGSGSSVDPADPEVIGGVTAAEGESLPLSVTLVYVGTSKSATVNLHVLAHDEDEACLVNGTLIPGTMAPG